MKLLNHIPGLALALLFSFAAFSCADDLDVRNSLPNTDDTTLTIYVPNVDAAADYAATRADNDNDNDYDYGYDSKKDLAVEAQINELYVFGFPVDNEGEKFFQKFSPADTDKNHDYVGQSNSQYKEYQVTNVKEGKYHIYVLANVDQYITPQEQNTVETYLQGLDEDNLKQLQLNFSSTLSVSNLPMACMYNEMATSPESTIKQSEISFNKDNNIVYADLTFLCAKVRYTVLFDNTTSTSFSSTFSSYENIDFEDNGVTASNVRKASVLTGTQPEGTIDVSSLSLNKVRYPSENSGYLKDPVELEENLNKINDKNKWDQGQRAWQGIIYIPENDNKIEEYKTALTFATKGDDPQLAESYTIPLFDTEKNSTLTSVERGKMYDIVARLVNSQSIDKDILVSVTGWSPATVAAELLGPIKLIVEQTSIPVQSGKYSTMGYETDVPVEFVTLISSKFQEESLFLLEKITPGMEDEDGEKYEFKDEWSYHLRITVNPEISYDDLKEAYEGGELNDLSYFHIKVGNLYKKIEVNPLDIEPMLEVSPLKIILDVKELTASGINSNDYAINFITNLSLSGSEYELRLTDGQGLINREDAATSALNIQYAEGLFTPGTDFFTANAQKGSLDLNIMGILSGNSDWNTPATYTLIFTIYKNGVPFIPDGMSQPLTRTVEIEVIPYTTDYVIHFRCIDPEHKWENPHVYVYQCLELPHNLGELRSDLAQLSGKTFGYYYVDNSATSLVNPVAALQYNFSNNVSFNGWLHYGGNIDIDAFSKGDYELVENDGFAMLKWRGNYERKSSGFNPEYMYNEDDKNKPNGFYNYDINLNYAHAKNQDKWVCQSICGKYSTARDYNEKRSNFKKDEKDGHTYYTMFAGVAMEKEEGANNGWYKYTLSGLATPGKCLIIFFNGHTWDDLGNCSDNDGHTSKEDKEQHYRYPCKDEDRNDTAGVPLFDFSDHEGWFIFDGNGEVNTTQNFRDVKPTLPALKSTDKIKFEWSPEYISGKDTKYIYFWIGTNNSGLNRGGWTALEGSLDHSTGLYTKTVYISDYSWLQDQMAFRCQVHDGGTGKSQDMVLCMEDYKDSYQNGTYTIRITGGETIDPNTKTYRIYWPTTNNYNGIYIWNWNVKPMDWNSCTTGIEGNYTYCEFRSSDHKSTTFNYKMTNGTNTGCTSESNGHSISKNFTEVDGIMCAYFTGHDHGQSSTLTLNAGKPTGGGGDSNVDSNKFLNGNSLTISWYDSYDADNTTYYFGYIYAYDGSKEFCDGYPGAQKTGGGKYEHTINFTEEHSEVHIILGNNNKSKRFLYKITPTKAQQEWEAGDETYRGNMPSLGDKTVSCIDTSTGSYEVTIW